MDSGNVDALVGIGIVDASIASSFMSDDPAPLLAAAEANLAKALALAPNHALAHRGLGMVFGRTKRVPRAIEEFERALAIDPNLARARASLGISLAFAGRAEETEAHVLEALRLSPRDPTSYVWFLHIGGAKAYLAEYEAAAAWLRKSIDANRNNAVPFFYLAACLAHLRRLDEARAEAKAGLAIDPKFTVARFRASIQSVDALFLAQRERLIEGMQIAGVPEG